MSDLFFFYPPVREFPQLSDQTFIGQHVIIDGEGPCDDNELAVLCPGGRTVPPAHSIQRNNYYNSNYGDAAGDCGEEEGGGGGEGGLEDVRSHALAEVLRPPRALASCEGRGCGAGGGLTAAARVSGAI